MKNITLSFCLFLLIFVSCKSKEEKAAELIKTELYKTLYDFSSYEPIETVVDSAFTTVYRDAIILSYGNTLNELLKKGNEYLDKAKEAQSMMEIWGDSYYSYGNSKYYEAKREFYSNIAIAKEYMDKMNAINDSIIERAKGLKRTFCGWEAKHKFRCKTKGGYSDLANYVFLIDHKFENIIYTEDTEDESLIKIRNLIDEVLEKMASSN